MSNETTDQAEATNNTRRNTIITWGVTALITVAITLTMTFIGVSTDSFSTPRAVAEAAAAEEAGIPLPVVIHLITVVPALLLGPFILWRKKGDKIHKLLGRIWAALMMVTAIASAFIGAPGGGIAGTGFSPIHIFTVWTLTNVPLAIWLARRGKIAQHKSTMTGLYVGLCIAGAFTLIPGRIIGNMVFG